MAVSSSVSVAFALLLVATSVSGETTAAPVVRTRQGAVRGVAKQSSGGRHFLAFYNLPYAKPPVGTLRFRSPQPPDTWVHIRDATVKGPTCTQNNILFPSAPQVGTEDCLYLNVFTPQLKPKEPLPVMFWIHGGGWVEGAGTWYEPGYFMDHDVVLVAINYRLGPLGFLSTEDEISPGNFGLKDQVAALKWVKENIEAFGGDPGSVTIFGESAGAGSVHYLMLSPLSKGLFHKAISQSGVSLSPWAVPQPGAAEKARKVASLVGCPTEPNAALVDCLRNVDEYRIAGTEKHFLEWYLSPLIPFRPAVEGDGEHSFLPKHPVYLEPHTAVPWLVGITKEEGCLFTGGFVRNMSLLQELKEDRERLFPLSLGYHTSTQAKLITEKINDFYFSSGEISLDKMTDVYTDALFTWNTDEAIRHYKDRAPVYYYLLSYKGQYRMTHVFGAKDVDLGVSHGDDLLYLFSNNIYCPISGERSKEDMEMVKVMTKLWTEFARTGNPTPNDEPLHWPRVTSDSELEYLELGQQLEVKKGLFQERVDFWRSLPLREPVQRTTSKEEL